MNPTNEDLLRRIRELEQEAKYWKAQVCHKKYGLTWIDAPETFDAESENKIPILEECESLSFKNKNSLPTHILIEGDNYHALTCLNYTHRNKVDIIYIDPPYNTGNDGFIYKDKRIFDQFPDGTSVPINSPLRHSYWLSFMKRRLILAKELLKDNGIMFISIDMNELAQLKLLCDSEDVFGASSFVECFIWNKTSTPPALSYKSRKTHEFILCYQKRPDSSRFIGMTSEGGDAPLLNSTNSVGILKFPAYYIQTSLKDGIYAKGNRERVELFDDVVVQDGIIQNSFSLRGKFRWQQSTLDREIENGCKLIVKSDKFAIRYCRPGERTVAPANYLHKRFYERDTDINHEDHNVDTNDTASKELSNIIGKNKFNFPKPVSLISYLLEFNNNPNSIVLDFFAGSGTTMHAVSSLNAKDGGRRQCILCQASEADICRSVTLERNRRVMQGYTNAMGEEVKGLGGSLKYYRTAFVGRHTAREASDADRIDLAARAGCLLALAENTLYETERRERFQFFTDRQGQHTAIYFSEDYSDFPTFETQVRQLEGSICIYVFSWGDGTEFAPMFDDLPHATVKSIPQPILDIYKSLTP